MTKQTEIPGCEDPQRNPEVDEVLYAYLDAKAAQKKAADATRIKHASLLDHLASLGITRYPYVDQFTGKKRYVVVAKEPKVKTQRAPSPRKPRAKREREKPNPDEQVEHRKVSRASVEAEIDPFAGVRRDMGAES